MSLVTSRLPTMMSDNAVGCETMYSNRSAPISAAANSTVTDTEVCSGALCSAHALSTNDKATKATKRGLIRGTGTREATAERALRKTGSRLSQQLVHFPSPKLWRTTTLWPLQEWAIFLHTQPTTFTYTRDAANAAMYGKTALPGGGIVTHITREGAHTSAPLRRVGGLTARGATAQGSHL